MSSLFTARAISYRIKMGFPHEKVLISVGVQKIVDARAAGVMFTLDPLNGDPSKVVIEGKWGLGETVVSGQVNPDKFVVDKVTKEIQRTISQKWTECIFDPRKAWSAILTSLTKDRRYNASRIKKSLNLQGMPKKD